MNASAAALEASPTLSTLMRAIEAVEVAERAAGDGERGRALELYGQAVDDLLEIGAYSLAASTARDMLDRFPGVVRARGTLAVLSLAAGLRRLSREQLETSRPQFELYITAARATGQEQAAICYLRSIFEESDSPVVREWLGTFLEELGADSDTVPAPGGIPGVDPADATPAPLDTTPLDRRWVRILRSPARVGGSAVHGEPPLTIERMAADAGEAPHSGQVPMLAHDTRDDLHAILAYVAVAEADPDFEIRRDACSRIRSAAFRIDQRLGSIPGIVDPTAAPPQG